MISLLGYYDQMKCNRYYAWHRLHHHIHVVQEIFYGSLLQEGEMNNLEENKHSEQGQDKDFTIIVNGRQKKVTKKELPFAEIVALAFDNPLTGPGVVYTITYRRGEGNKPEGTLVEGETIKIKEGMIFNVTATNKS